MIIYIYSNETGKQVDVIEGTDNQACEQAAADKWGSNDYHWSYTGTFVSNAVAEHAYEFERVEAAIELCKSCIRSGGVTGYSIGDGNAEAVPEGSEEAALFGARTLDQVKADRIEAAMTQLMSLALRREQLLATPPSA